MGFFSRNPLQHTLRRTDCAAAVELSDVRLTYPSARSKSKAGVSGIDLTIKNGEIVALLGPSGCGKTTTLRLIAGLERADSGTISMRGEIVCSASRFVASEHRRVGFMFQDFALFPHLTVLENVTFGLRRQKVAVRNARALELLNEVGLAERANDYPDRLSGGQQQRVALARALAPQPDMILLDEPFSGLDAGLRTTLRAETARILRKVGCTVVMVTHDGEEAMFMADRIVLMNNGNIEQIGSPADLYHRPATAYAASFLGEVNRFDAVVHGGECWTPAGMIATPGHSDGTSVDIVVRPEDLKIERGPATCGRCSAGAVSVRRSLGQSALLQVDIEDTDLNVTARTGLHSPLVEGDVVNVSVTDGGAMVFAR